MKRLLLIVACAWVGVGYADEKILVDAKINGKRSPFIFDTGAFTSVLFPDGAKRLGLKVNAVPTNDAPSQGHATLIGQTEPFNFALGYSALRMSLPILEWPDYLHANADGVLAWSNLRRNIFKIDAVAGKVTGLESLPSEVALCMKFRILTNSELLALEIPRSGAPPEILVVDTGKADGITLRPDKWRAWRAAHRHQPITLHAAYMPGAGLTVKEESWAREFAFGPLTFEDVPIMEANIAEAAFDSPRFAGSIGLAALKHLHFIVNGKEGVVYVRAREGSAPPYEHNRLGAVFVPRDPQNDDLVARVVKGGPAEAVGIRDGDVLLKIGKLDVIKWRTNPKVLPLTRFWERPAGTQLELTLRRGDRVFKTVAVLRDILMPPPFTIELPGQ